MRLVRASLLAGFLGLAPHLRAQVQLGVGADAHSRPGGQVVASLMAGARVVTGRQTDGETEATFDGWVDNARLGARRDSFPATVAGKLTLRVRSKAAPNATVIAVLQPGTGVHTLGRQGNWMHVRRTVWIPNSALVHVLADARRQSSAQPSVPPAAPARPDSPATSGARVDSTGAAGSGRSVVASTGAHVYDIPVGRVVGGITPGSAVEIVGRQFGWVHVRADGWVPEKDLVSGAGVAQPSITAADLRADPEGMKGRVVQWDVEVMSLQTADPLRVDLRRDEPYLLARGPGDENVVLYLAVPPSLLTDARALAPLSHVTITAKVRSGRSEPAGTPILDLVTIVKR